MWCVLNPENWLLESGSKVGKNWSPVSEKYAFNCENKIWSCGSSSSSSSVMLILGLSCLSRRLSLHDLNHHQSDHTHTRTRTHARSRAKKSMHAFPQFAFLLKMHIVSREVAASALQPTVIAGVALLPWTMEQNQVNIWLCIYAVWPTQLDTGCHKVTLIHSSSYLHEVDE